MTSQTTPAARPAKKPARTSAVRRVADAIRRDALGKSEGELLGSEQDLLDRYGVSRPTLRQAAALVVQENLLRARRGVGGGYFVSRPSSAAVAHVAAVFLRSRGTTQEQVIRAIEPVRIELAKLSASCSDTELRAGLQEFLAAEEVDDPANSTLKVFVRRERQFARLVAKMSGNNVLALFLEILYDYFGLVERHEDYYRDRPDRIDAYRSRRNQLARAILEGDTELAELAARRCQIMFGNGTDAAGEGGLVAPGELIDLIAHDRLHAAPLLKQPDESNFQP